MKRMIVACLAALVSTATVAAAQGYPPTASARGYELGIQQLNNTGQVGTVTMFNRGPKTLLVVRLKGAEDKVQPLGLYRAKACDEPIPAKPEFRLAPVKHGVSTTTAPLSWDRLLSGNYSVVTLTSTAAAARPAACGHLYQS